MSKEKCKQRFPNLHPWKPSQPLTAAAPGKPMSQMIVGLPPSMDLSELNQRMLEQLTNLTSQIALLTQAVTALTAAIQENTEAMGGEEEEVAQTGGFLGDTTEEEAPAPYL